MSLRQLIQRPMPVTAPLVLNPLMARMAEAAGFQAIEIEDQGARAGDRRGRQAVTVTTTRG